ncbi:hypothetical protein GCM10010497_02420 [Streptomyces cinereoruber]|uniref:Uncharacterized protein n=1 Tax=Streptomyces cinereoruber TaxID=67260 RepID=A0AAV4KDF3_9ACTN|nr:hypothetical protein GCM10010497_02420 [Streptomyces cinereoruber]
MSAGSFEKSGALEAGFWEGEVPSAEPPSVWSPQAVSSMEPATAMAATAARREVRVLAAVVQRVERAVMVGFLRRIREMPGGHVRIFECRGLV